MFSRTNLSRLSLLIIGIAITALSCQKINDATTLGGSLIPAVDNVNTFDTTLAVETINGLFTQLNDSTLIGPATEHFAGNISNDPLFGKTSATMYLELKPSFPYTFDFKNIDSLLQLDSVVLVLGYTHTFGDSLTPIDLSVKEISQLSDFRYDSNYLLRSNSFVLGSTLGGLTNIIPATLDDSIKVFRDSTVGQLRIPLDNSFGMRLLSYDSPVYNSDSAFRTHFKGFAILPVVGSGNALLGFDLQSANTKLAFYYHYKDGAITDTASVSYFTFGSQCAHANLIERDYTGSQLASYQGSSTPQDLVFIQNTPGSYATIKVPDLAVFPNRVILRAELIAEQVYDASPSSDNTFATPDLLFLDAYDNTLQSYRTIPYDFYIDQVSGGPNYLNFGMEGKTTVDANGHPIKVWKIDLTRYIQNYLIRKEPLYNFRIFAPYSTRDYYRFNGVDTKQYLGINSQIAAGRVRLGGGNHPTQRMKLHIIYSNL